jgi:hypothetical protein
VRLVEFLRLLAACKDTSKRDTYVHTYTAPPTSPSTITENHARGQAPRNCRTSFDAVDATPHEQAPRE